MLQYGRFFIVSVVGNRGFCVFDRTKEMEKDILKDRRAAKKQ